MLQHAIPTPFSEDIMDKVPYHRLLIAAFCVGFGTRLANGCTSGHGVCGLSRLSRRSIIATAIFTLSAVVTATITKSYDMYPNIEQLNKPYSFSSIELPSNAELRWMIVFIAFAGLLPPFLAYIFEHVREEKHTLIREAIQYVVGLSFAAGLITSGMSNPSKVIAFLYANAATWDPSMLFVFAGALPLAFLGFRPLLLGAKPALAHTHSLPTRSGVDVRLLSGSIIFGFGWGLVGFCPGPAFVSFGAYPFDLQHIRFLVAMLLGSYIGKVSVKVSERWGL